MARKLFGSQRSLRDANRANLLDTVRKLGAMTQVELAEVIGVSTATVSAMVHELSDEGLIETRNTTRNGRRATLVVLAHKPGLAVGLCVTRHDLRVVIIDSSNTILAEHHLPLALRHLPDTTMERACQLINETLESIGSSHEEMVGIGVALGAPVDSSTHMVAIPGLLPGWEDFDVATFLDNVFHVPVVIDNDANLCALCESRIGSGNGVESFVYVNCNDGVGAGLIRSNDVWHGVTGLAGEIGHVQVDPLGSICLCGNRGCLNTVVDEQRLTSLLNVTHGNLTLADLVKKSNEGDPGCRRVIADAANRIGGVVATTCIAMDPEIVVVGGQLAQAGDVFLEPFAENLQRLLFPNYLTPIEVVPAKYPLSCGALGAAIEAMEQAMHLSLTK